MKKCPVCGVEHSDIVPVCSICGSSLAGVESISDAAPAAPTPAPAPAAGNDFSADDVQAAVSSVVNATIDEHKAAPAEPEDFDDDSPFVVNAMRDFGNKKPSAAREAKSPSRSSAPKKAYSSKKVTPEQSKPGKRQSQSQSEQSKSSAPAIDTTAVAAVSAQKVYEAAQNAINARNAHAAANPQPQEPEQKEWSERKHKRRNGSNGAIIAACALVLLLIIAIIIFVFKLVTGGNNTKSENDGNNTNISDTTNPGDATTEDEQGDTTILPEQDADGEDSDTEDPDDNTPDDDNTTEDPDASVIGGDGDTDADTDTPTDQPDDNQTTGGNDTEEPGSNDDQPVVVPTELPAITEANDTVYATAGVNVRDYPSAQTSNVINVLSAGQAVKRTGIISNGWSRVDLGNGTIGYVSNSYLSTSKDSGGDSKNDNKNSDSSVAYANTDVNVRSAPGGDVIAALPKGTEVKLTGTTSGNWTQITAGDVSGYVYTSYLTGAQNSSDNKNTDQPKVTVKDTNDTVYATTGVNVRDYPSSSTGNVVATLTQGQEVTRIGTTANGWSQIKVGSTTGYVYSGYLSTSKDSGSDSKNDNKNSGSSKSSSYILSESGTRKYTKDELSSLSKSDLRLARNEIYARHGRKFSDESLQKYFEGKSWYSGTIDAATFDANVSSYLNSYELANLMLIQELENG